MGNLKQEIKDVTLENAPENAKLISSDIQKDIINAAATETINVIVKDIGDALFSILVDESRDVSMKEQMAVVLRYVDKKGCVIERFVGIEHVTSTMAISLKAAIDRLFSRYGLSIARLRGQGYDGASNMQGEFNGLKALILKENPCAFYIHCFAHQLQLALVGVAKKHVQVANFFCVVASVVNVVGASPKRSDILQEKQIVHISQALQNGEVASDTLWGSHYGTLLSLLTLFSSTIEVLEIIVDDASNSEQRYEATNLLDNMQSYRFVFCLHLMRIILGVSNESSKALQRKDQDIANAIGLVKVCKQRLQEMRENDWDSFIGQVSSFCEKHNIDVPNMDDIYIPRGRSRRKTYETTNLHHYRVDLYYSIIDMQLQELNGRFDEVNTKLLLCIACLCPDNLFVAFEKQNLLQLAGCYPKDFSTIELMALDDQLQNYIIDMRSSIEFSDLKGISNLAKKMVEMGKDKVYPLVYRLLTLSLILPVATATVERVFSAMHLVKTRLRNRIGDQWLNDSLVVYIEKDIYDNIDNEVIMRRFQNMKTRRGNL
ncbi:hypothetical protein J5N97_013949 [Dioscorea zingiberensis]|uniref:Zinc finger MYM-type protein 1-like n=1 Tax=Dioscorea zingiberensis TaxID=325984 RepID=A0A9D5CUA7_9LILI|nr:hypothetical protein J5N97_013949 [Dioscorea zingiberensis]